MINLNTLGVPHRNGTEKNYGYFCVFFREIFLIHHGGGTGFWPGPPSPKILNKKIENYGEKLHFPPKIFGTETWIARNQFWEDREMHQRMPPLVLRMMMRTIINTTIWDTQNVCLYVINFFVSSVFNFIDINDFLVKISVQKKEQTDWCILMLFMMIKHHL